MSTMKKLRVSTPSDTEIVMTREFNAPRRMVFEALTTPELLKKWMGPPEWPLVSCEIDLRVGGKYRFVASGPDGMEMGWGGEYLKVVPPERFVATEQFDQAWYPGVARVTTELSERDGKTTVTTTIRYESKEARDMVLSSPMEQGVTISYDRLEKLLSERAEV
ncbi:MAG: SRPBCC family protein [Phycisphaerales bacterium]|nr:SRPBCC family protein [Phycisphaerales bacterium]